MSSLCSDHNVYMRTVRDGLAQPLDVYKHRTSHNVCKNNWTHLALIITTPRSIIPLNVLEKNMPKWINF